jgi:hypothetical protein
MRKFVVLTAVVTALAVGASPALGTTGTATGGDLTVTVALTDDAVRGAQITVAESITNTLAQWQFVTVTQTLVGPAGRQFSFSYPILVGPSKTRAFSFTFTVPKFAPTGLYTLTLTTKTKTGTATATAAATVS